MGKLLSCTCKHPFQDKRYGVKKRIHNAQGGKAKGRYRCTVCGDSKVVETPKGEKNG